MLGLRHSAHLGCRFALLLGIPALTLPPLWAAGQALALWTMRLAPLILPYLVVTQSIGQPKEGRMSLRISYRARSAPPAWPIVEPPPIVDKSAGRDGAELRRQTAVMLANRHLLQRIAALPRLTQDQERLAIAQFRIKNGVTRCPPAYLLPTNNAL